MKKILSLIMILLLGMFLVSCFETEDNFKVTYEAYGGDPVPSSLYVKSGSLITKPISDPSKDGYVFIGWFQDNDFKTKWEFDVFKIFTHTKLYALYEKIPQPHLISFDVDGGTPYLEDIEVEEGRLLPVPRAITKEGYVFKGWYLNEGRTEKFNFNQQIETDLTLYAKWEKSFTGYRAIKKVETSFTIAILPDTQIYTNRGKVPHGKEIFDAQMNYIVSQHQQENIKFTASVGDIVDRANDILMWNIATNAFKILEEANLPYGVTAGNHDFPGLTNDGRFYVYNDDERTGHQNYLSYFPKTRAQKYTENYGGHSANGWNSYYYFNGNDQKYLVLFLDYYPSENTLNWANQVMEENSNVPTILVSHILIRNGSQPSNGYFQYDEAKYLFNNFIKRHDQIIIALSGHYTGQGYAIMENDYGNDIIFIMTDYQGDYNGGNGMMNLLEFDTENNLLNLHSFSPYVMEIPEDKRNPLNDIEILRDNRNNYSLPFDYQQRFNSFINKE